MSNSEHLPWQTTAKKLIKYASEFRSDDEYRRQAGYLLLDVGVETLLKSYLMRPDIKTKMGFKQREEAVKGTVERDNIPDKKITLSVFDEQSFHNLTLAVRQAAGDTVEKEALEKVEFFHTIRNKIYHSGTGVVPAKENFEEYLALAQSLLSTLLGVNQDTEDTLLDMDGDQLLDYALHIVSTQHAFYDFQRDVAVATTLLRPGYAIKNFKEELKQLWDEYVDTLSPGSGLPSSVYEYAESELIKKFSSLTGQKIMDTEFILESCYDVTYLQLAVLLSKLQEDVANGLKTYIKFRGFSKKKIVFGKITQEDIDAVDSLSVWIEKTDEKINSWVESKISEN